MTNDLSAAIASALVFHQEKVSQHSNEKLEEAHAELEKKPWMPAEFKNLFRKARAVCGQRKQKP